MAFLAIALSGHANSAEPRPLAVATDWLHLLAGAVWMGGLAQIVSAGRDRRQPLRPSGRLTPGGRPPYDALEPSGPTVVWGELR